MWFVDEVRHKNDSTPYVVFNNKTWEQRVLSFEKLSELNQQEKVKGVSGDKVLTIHDIAIAKGQFTGVSHFNGLAAEILNRPLEFNDFNTIDYFRKRAVAYVAEEHPFPFVDVTSFTGINPLLDEDSKTTTAWSWDEWNDFKFQNKDSNFSTSVSDYFVFLTSWFRLFTSVDTRNRKTDFAEVSTLTLELKEYPNLTSLMDCFSHNPKLTSVILDCTGFEGKITTFKNAFWGCEGLESVDFKNVNDVMPKCVDISSMFTKCSNLLTLHLRGWNTSKVRYFSNIFSECSCLHSVDVSDWDMSSLVKCNKMFENCSALEILDLSSWKNCSKLLSCESVFQDCVSLRKVNLPSLVNKSGHIICDNMFFGCTSLEEVVFPDNWKQDRGIRTYRMFEGCVKLEKIDMSNVILADLCDHMFSGCTSVKEIKLGAVLENSRFLGCNMFNGCHSLKRLYLPECSREHYAKWTNLPTDLPPECSVIWYK